MSTVRHPAVAGRFYPAQPEILMRDLQSYLAPAGEKIEAAGCVVPHAGYMYSGHVAGAVFGRLALPQRFIILCPNHTGFGKPLAIMSEGAWQTPLGQAEIDHELATELRSAFHSLSEDSNAHRAEHALEVELPFIQALRRTFTFVPIAVGVGAYEPLAELGEAMARVVAASDEKILIVASSDMNHYESEAITRVKDKEAIEQIFKLDARGLYDVVVTEHISMCGYGSTVAMLTAAKRLGAHSADLIKYATSADVSGDRETVVGYAGVIVH